MAASIKPRPPDNSPFMSEVPARVPINVMPIIAMMNNSGEPKSKTSGRIIGIERARERAPIVEPTRELMMAAPKARPASPFFDMGYPSSIKAAEDPSPGIPNSMDVKSPVVPVTASIPRRNANAEVGSLMLYEKGSISAKVDKPPMPGSSPTQKPMAMPNSM